MQVYVIDKIFSKIQNGNIALAMAINSPNIEVIPFENISKFKTLSYKKEVNASS